MGHHPVSQPVSPRGFTLIEVMIGLAIFTIVVGAVYSGYNAVIDIVSTTQSSSAAVSIIESRVEMVRNMRYEDVGTVNGIPSGILAQTEDVILGSTSFSLTTTVLNVDNPFDGTVTGSGSKGIDLNPADYKLVQFDITCPTCGTTGTYSMVTYVAPKTLEDESRNGSLEVSVVDASGQPVPQATVHIENPAKGVDLTTTTDNTGKRLLLSMATGSAEYAITVSKNGYSTDYTTPLGNPANALKPHVTIATQQLTLQTMVIDRVSSMTVSARDRFCASEGPFDVRLTGSKLLGITPNVPKYSEAHTVSSGGSLSLTGLEWDAFTFVPSDSALMLVGAGSPLSVTLDPNTTEALEWVLAPAVRPGALITVTDSAGTPIDGALVSLTGPSLASSQYSGHWVVGDSDWSNNQYSDVSAGMHTSTEGMLTLEEVGGEYATGSAETLTSLTFDLGTSGVTLRELSWGPEVQPDDTSVQVQVAANNDNTTWEYVGPDGTTATYFDTPGVGFPSSLNGKRYIRYKVYLETAVTDATPSLESIGIVYHSDCLTSGHAFFEGLTSAASYDVTVQASGFVTALESITLSDEWTQLIVPLTPQ